MNKRIPDEGVIKYRAEHVDGEIGACPHLRDLLVWRSELFDRGLIGNDDGGVGFGNVSVRLFSSPRFVVSGTQTSGLAQVDRRHFAEVSVVDLEQNLVRSRGRARPSSEVLTHAALYQADIAIGGVAHVHSEALWNRHRGHLPTTDDRATYGTTAMGYEMIRLHRRGEVRQQGVIVMGGHPRGLVAFGPTIALAVRGILDLLA